MSSRLHRGGEALLLELLFHAAGLQSVNALGPNLGHGRDEAGQLVAGVERLVQRRDARAIGQIVGVRLDRVDHVLGIAVLGQDGRALQRMVGRVRPALVVEVVQQADDAPGRLRRRPAGGRRPASRLRRPACACAGCRWPCIRTPGPRPVADPRASPRVSARRGLVASAGAVVGLGGRFRRGIGGGVASRHGLLAW